MGRGTIVPIHSIDTGGSGGFWDERTHSDTSGIPSRYGCGCHVHPITRKDDSLLNDTWYSKYTTFLNSKLETTKNASIITPLSWNNSDSKNPGDSALDAMRMMH